MASEKYFRYLWPNFPNRMRTRFLSRLLLLMSVRTESRKAVYRRLEAAQWTYIQRAEKGLQQVSTFYYLASPADNPIPCHAVQRLSMGVDPLLRGEGSLSAQHSLLGSMAYTPNHEHSSCPVSRRSIRLVKGESCPLVF